MGSSTRGSGEHDAVVLWVHNDSLTKDHVIVNRSAISLYDQESWGDALRISARSKGSSGVRKDNSKDHSGKVSDSTKPVPIVCLARDAPEDVKKKQPNLQISISQKLANLHGFSNRTHVILEHVESKTHSSTFVEILVRNALSRADLWSFVTSDLIQQPCIYEGQQLLYLGTARATIKKIFVGEKRVRSGLFTHLTKPIFRSESARIMIGIQMSREMWDYDSEASGGRVWDLVLSFIDRLFERWISAGSRHLVTVVFFTRTILYSPEAPDKHNNHPNKPTEDFFRVVANELSSADRTLIIQRLQQRFASFRHDIQHAYRKSDFSHSPSIELETAACGNVLEAANLLATQSISNTGDPTLSHYGTSVVLITPSIPEFQVSRELLKLTTERLNNGAISVDFISLRKPATEISPLFRFDDTDNDGSEGQSTNLQRSVMVSWAEASYFNSTDDSGHNGFGRTTSGPQDTPRHSTLRLQHFERCNSSIGMEEMASSTFGGGVTDMFINISHEKGHATTKQTHKSKHRRTASPDLDAFDDIAFLDEPGVKVSVLPKSARTHTPDSISKKQTSRGRKALSTSKSNLSEHDHDSDRHAQDRGDIMPKLSEKDRSRVSSRRVSSQLTSNLGALLRGDGIKKATATTSASVGSVNFSKPTYSQQEETGPIKGNVSDRFRESLARRPSIAASSSISMYSNDLRSQSSMETIRAASSIADENDEPVDTQTPIQEDKSKLLTPSHLTPRPPNVPPWVTKRSKDPGLPWYVVDNPCRKNRTSTASFGVWKHTIPSETKVTKKVMWTSLQSPAVLPFESDERVEFQTLREHFTESPYKLSVDTLSGSDFGVADLAREMTECRLLMGYQLVSATGPRDRYLERDRSGVLEHEGDTQLMIRGDHIQLLAISGDELSVIRYLRKASPPAPYHYEFHIQTEVADRYIDQERDFAIIPDANWNRIDHEILARLEDTSVNYNIDVLPTIATQKARFVLIPVEINRGSRQSGLGRENDTDEEIRIDGIRKLTILWQKFRHIAADDSHVHIAWAGHEDPNPLAIEFQTRDPSVVIAAGLENTLLTEGEITVASTRLFEGNEFYRTSNFDVQRLAQDIQGEKGIKIKDRRWHLRIHHHCFVGVELTSWLLTNFQDLKSREEAEAFGHILMENGLFHHVQKKHGFRDGNYFYSVAPEHRISMKHDAKGMGWFSGRKTDASSPATPLSDSSKEHKSTPKSMPRNFFDATSVKKPAVALTAAIQYDLDHRKKSRKPEIVTIHYDRLHNPDNAYHFQLEWTNTTTKLVEDAVAAWTMNVERYGLKLVQVPLNEVSAISEFNPLRLPYRITLWAETPLKDERQPDESKVGATSPHDPLPYHRALLRSKGFVLDMEANATFPADVRITYSWSIPPYRHSQFIHRSGVLLAQVTDDGGILLMANRLYTIRAGGLGGLKRPDERISTDTERRQTSGQNQSRQSSSAVPPTMVASPIMSPRLLPRSGPSLASVPTTSRMPSLAASQTHTAEQLKDDLERFCHDKAALEAFFEQISEPIPIPADKGTPALSATSSKPTPALQPSMPLLELPSPSLAGTEGDALPPLTAVTSHSTNAN